LTILLNELHVGENFAESFIVAAADRQTLLINGRIGPKHRKLHEIPYLNAAASYFGLAAWKAHGRERHMSEWLSAFIRGNSNATDLYDFARRLQGSLNTFVPPSVLRVSPSGFHLVGFDAELRPDFLFVTNIGSMDGFQYADFRSNYGEPSSDFLGRDARKLGWDGAGTIQEGSWVYRNGDIRSHVIGSGQVDSLLMALGEFPDFRLPSNRVRYRDYVKFKLEILAYYYKHWARRQLIGRPIDAILLRQLSSLRD
jgi:hypothetical protein